MFPAVHPPSRPDPGAVDRALALARDADRLAAREKWPAALALYEAAWREIQAASPGPIGRADGGAVSGGRGSEEQNAAPRVQAIRERLAEHLGVLLAPERAALTRLRARLSRGLLAVAALAVLALGGRFAYRARFLRDLSEGAEWVASSHTAARPLQGKLPRRTLGWAEPAYFFHTQVEADPWVTIDLGASRLVRAIEIVNRLDCCWERAAQLTIELSADGVNFHLAARRSARPPVPRRWFAKVTPQRARWVRVLAPQTTALHLADVRVLGQ